MMDFIHTDKFYTVKTKYGIYENVEIVGYSDGFVMVKKFDGIRFSKTLINKNSIQYIKGPFKDQETAKDK